MRIVIGDASPQWRAAIAQFRDRIYAALDTAVNMARSMLEQEAREDIGASGNFGARWTDGLHVKVDRAGDNYRLAFTHDIEYAGIFETGGTISGQPLLWIPISGTDAVGVAASAFGGGLRGARYPRKSGPPLLFSLADRQPKYFGVNSVTLAKKWHIDDVIVSVMSNFKDYFTSALAGG